MKINKIQLTILSFVFMILFSNCSKEKTDEPAPIVSFTETEKLLHGGSEKAWKGVSYTLDGMKVSDTCLYSVITRLKSNSSYRKTDLCKNKDTIGVYKHTGNTLFFNSNTRDTFFIVKLIPDSLKVKTITRYKINGENVIFEFLLTYIALK